MSVGCHSWSHRRQACLTWGTGPGHSMIQLQRCETRNLPKRCIRSVTSRFPVSGLTWGPAHRGSVQDHVCRSSPGSLHSVSTVENGVGLSVNLRQKPYSASMYHHMLVYGPVQNVWCESTVIGNSIGLNERKCFIFEILFLSAMNWSAHHKVQFGELVGTLLLMTQTSTQIGRATSS